MVEMSEEIPLDVTPEPPVERVPPITNRFLFVDVAAQRAKQLRRGARPRLDAPSLPHKLERVAMEEVRQGFIPHTVPDVKPTAGGGSV